MQTTVEISLYPLRDDYIPAIDWFIASLDRVNGLQRTTSATSTLVVGEHHLVMDTVRDLSLQAHQNFGLGVLVCKVIVGLERA